MITDQETCPTSHDKPKKDPDYTIDVLQFFWEEGLQHNTQSNITFMVDLDRWWYFLPNYSIGRYSRLLGIKKMEELKAAHAAWILEKEIWQG